MDAPAGSTGEREGTWRARLRAWLGPGLAPELRPAFALEMAETGRSRGALLLPLMVVAHVIHVAVFLETGASRAALSSRVLMWRDGIALTHALTAVLALALAVVAIRGAGRRRDQHVGPLIALLYLLHGAIIAGIDQITVTSVTPFVGYALGIAVVVPLWPRTALLLYGVALAVFVGGVETFQVLPEARLAMLPNGASIVLVGAALSVLAHAARRRDFLQRHTIESQRRALADLNAGLERRIAEQVSEALERTEEVQRLNAQLTAQVRARSTELSIALSRLARQRDTAGVLRKGALLGDRFEVGDRIGEGGMGAVYSGLDRSTGQRVAIKVIQASSTEELDAFHRFLREAASTAAVVHPAVVRMLHVDVAEEGMLYQVQELVEGVTLQRRVRSGHRWAPGTVARVVSVLGEALAAAHAGGVVHRDVKPGNLMLTTQPPGLKLLDFGIAKLYEDALVGDSRTRTGVVLGTPAFMAPEQLDPSETVTDRADVYAAGVVMFLLLTGKYPFDDATPRKMMLSHVLRAAPDARSLAPDVPADIADLVARCLEKEPAQRPSAAELAGTLSRIADGLGMASLSALEIESELFDLDAKAAERAATVVGVPGLARG